jgi:hypothetical protein
MHGGSRTGLISLYIAANKQVKFCSNKFSYHHVFGELAWSSDFLMLRASDQIIYKSEGVPLG